MKIVAVLWPLSLLLCVLGAQGCVTHHYLVITEGTPLYRSEAQREVIARIPQFHHEPLGQSEPLQTAGLVRIRYGDWVGYVDVHNVRLFSYRSPEHYGPEERDHVLRRTFIEAVCDLEGYDEELRTALVRGIPLVGMTRGMILLAMGEPDGVEPALTGRETWLYHYYQVADDGDAQAVYLPRPVLTGRDELPVPGLYLSGAYRHPALTDTRRPDTTTRFIEFGMDGKVSATGLR